MPSKASHGLTAANIQTGGVTIDGGTNTIGISQSLLAGTGSGGLNKTGNGTLYLNGVNTYTGTTLVSQGAHWAARARLPVRSVWRRGRHSLRHFHRNADDQQYAGAGCWELDRHGAEQNASTNDVVTGVTALTCGGTLVLKNLGGMLAVNDTFKLFNAATYGGSFSSVVS